MGIPTWGKIFIDTNFGDKRRNKRLIQTAQQIEYESAKKGASATLTSHAELKAVSRVLKSNMVTLHTITEGFIRATCENLNASHVLLVEDTSEINFGWRKKQVSGLGPTGNGKDQGFFLHPVIVIEPEIKEVLGLAGIEVLIRKHGQHTTLNDAYRRKPIEEKESYRWITAAHDGCQQLPSETRKTIVADREADIFDLFLFHHEEQLGDNCELLIRASRNRRIANSEKCLFEEIENWEPKFVHTIKIENSQKRSARDAVCSVRFERITIEAPWRYQKRGFTKNIPGVYVIDVREDSPPEGEEPLNWKLLTTWTIESVADAMEKIEWYSCRWYIEELFRILKSGYQTETVHFKDAQQLINWCALRLMMAIKLLYIKTHRDDETPGSASEIFSDMEIRVLESIEDELISSKSTIRRPLAGSIAWASLLVAIMGGYQALPSAKPFGQTTLWRGLARFESIVTGYTSAIKNMGRS